MEPKFFTSQFNEHAEEFKQYLPVNINLRFETVESHLALCEETYIRPLLGKTLFNALAAYVEENPTLPDEDPQSVLVHKVRFALLRLAIWKGYDVIAANISDTGISNEVDKENRLYRYQEENIKTALKEEGFNYLDSILEYLEENSQDFPGFGDSQYKLGNVGSLIRNTAQFQQCYDIGGSRLVFLKMRPYIRDVELIELQHRIGEAFYRELVQKYTGGYGCGIVASGGVTDREDVVRLSGLGLSGIIIGRALYNGAVDLSDAVRIAEEAAK